MIIVYFLMLFALGTATESQEEVKTRIERSLKEPNWIMDKIKHPLEQVPYLNHMKHTSSRSLIRPKGATSSDDYAVFLKELSALGRILNGLTLDRQLRKGQLDVVQVVSEMAGVAVNQTLIDELAARKWTDTEQAVEEVSTQLAGFSGATWQDQKISDGLTALGALVDKVKPTAETLDVEKIDKFLKAIDDFNAEDFKVFDGNPAKDLLANLNAIEALTAASSPSEPLFKETRENIQKVEAAMKALDSSKVRYDALEGSLNSNFDAGKAMLAVIPLLQSSSGESQKINDLAQELGSFSESLDKLGALSNGLSSLSPPMALLKKYTTALSETPTIKLTLGLPHGPADLDAISSDLRLSRNQKLISGGGNMTVLESSFNRLNLVKVGLKQAVADWMSLQKTSPAPLDSLSALTQMLMAFATTASGTSGSSSALADFSTSTKSVIAGIADNSLADLASQLANAKKIDAGFLYFTFVPSAQNRKMLEDLSNLLDAIDSTKHGSTAILDNLKNLPTLAEIKTSLNAVSGVVKTTTLSATTLFTDIHAAVAKISTKTARTLKDWLVGVKEYQKPDGLDTSFSDNRRVVGDVKNFNSTSLDSVKEVIVEAQKMKTSVESIRSQTPSKSRARRQVTIDGWAQLDALSFTIGHAVRSALVMSPTDGIAGKLEQLSKASKELDEVLKATTDQSTRSEVENEWKGYGSIEAEVSVVQTQVKKVVESVPKKLESLKDLAVVVEKMTLVNMKFAKATAAAEAVKRIPTTTGDRNVKQKVEEVQNALEEVITEHQAFARSYRDLQMAPDALESISKFFASFFGTSQTPTSDPTTPTASFGFPVVLMIGISAGVLALVGIVGGFFCFMKKKKERAAPTPLTPATSRSTLKTLQTSEICDKDLEKSTTGSTATNPKSS